MSFKLFSAIGASASLIAFSVFLIPETVGHASSGVSASAEQFAERPPAPMRIELPAGWSRVARSNASDGAFALRCEAKGCIPGVTITANCVSAEGPLAGSARELIALASERQELRSERDAVTSEASVLAIGGHEFHERSSVLNDGRYVLTAATKVDDKICGLGLTGPRSEGARLDLTIRSMLSRLRFS